MEIGIAVVTQTNIEVSGLQGNDIEVLHHLK